MQQKMGPPTLIEQRSGPSIFSGAEIRLEEFLNLEDFPLHDLASTRRREVVEACQAQLQEDGCCVVPGFITPSAIESMRDEALRLMTHVKRTNSSHNPYFEPEDTSYPETHPKRRFQHRTNTFISSHLLESQSVLRKFYDSDVIVHFLSECLQFAPMYRWADPIGCSPYSMMYDGDIFPWHFDGNEFTVTILIQESDEGGEFEYCPNLRRPGEENFKGVEAVLDGDRSVVKTLTLKPGDLQIFKGRYSLHRVTKARSEEPRIIAIPAYSQNPYLMNRPHHCESVYGQYFPIHVERDIQRVDDLSD